MTDWIESDPEADPRTLIETTLSDYLDEARRQIEKIHPSGIPMLEEIAGLIGAGGKRVRPLLCYWGHIAAGGAHCEPLLRVSASLELLHTFALLHDDLMDGSATRRGRPAAHARAGAAFAVLCGDLAFTLSDGLLWSSGFPPAAVRTAAYHLHQMRVETLVGQHLDLIGSDSAEQALAAARLKTGSYTITGPLKVGASLAGADPQQLGVLDRYGYALGEAYQLVDDLQGAFDPAAAGKDPKDAGHPITLLLRAAEIQPGSAAVTGEQDPDGMRERLITTGVPGWALGRIRALVAEAKAALGSQDTVTLHPSALVVLNQVADSVRSRAERIPIDPGQQERGRD